MKRVEEKYGMQTEKYISLNKRMKAKITKIGKEKAEME